MARRPPPRRRGTGRGRGRAAARQRRRTGTGRGASLDGSCRVGCLVAHRPRRIGLVAAIEAIAQPRHLALERLDAAAELAAGLERLDPNAHLTLALAPLVEALGDR